MYERAKVRSTIPLKISVKKIVLLDIQVQNLAQGQTYNNSVIFQVVHIQPDVMIWDDLNVEILLYLLLERPIRECL